MEEKKMTDEIVDILTDFDEYGVQATVTMPNAEEYAKDWKNRLIDLFHRLQDENAKQKAELEKLHTLTDMQEANVKKMFENNMGLRKEIERLIKENEGQRKIIEYQDSVEDKNADLKKQVDELKKDLFNAIELLKEGGELAKMNNQIITEIHEQTVKDTAKEITSKVVDLNIICGDDFRLFLDNFELWIKERYGLEVE